MTLIKDVRCEHYRPDHALGVHETVPRISWTYETDEPFWKKDYNIEVSEFSSTGKVEVLNSTNVVSSTSQLQPWPISKPLRLRQRVSVRIQGVSGKDETTSWSKPSIPEIGLLDSTDWIAKRIADSNARGPTKSYPEQLFRRAFNLEKSIASARLYITAQGLYEAEINGNPVGDYFLALGFTENTVIAQLEVTLDDGTVQQVVSDESWTVTERPTLHAKIYDGEKYDGTNEVDGRFLDGDGHSWQAVEVLDSLSERTKLVAGYGEPVRRIETRRPIEQITTPSGKTILDFGQYLMGYLRIEKVRGKAGHKIILKHAKVLEHDELGTRLLRDCKATDEYTVKGSSEVESWEPRFTFYGFRYAQFDNWPAEFALIDSIEAVICHTDMKKAGHFECSDTNLNKLYENVCWSMRGNFLSIPTDCPQRDERPGWTGDLALFAPTAAFIYQWTGILKNWHIDLGICQKRRDGLPPMVCPDPLEGDRFWDLGIPNAIWHDVAVLGLWTMYRATGDVEILRIQYESMQGWLSKIRRHEGSQTPNLWYPGVFH